MNCLNEKLQKNLTFKEFNQIQKITIPEIIESFHKNSFLIESPTGSGKTFSFLLPLIEILAFRSDQKYSRSSGILALILVPTKELAQQIFMILESLLQSTCNWLIAGILDGADKRKSEKSRLRKGLNFLVCTPGRLIDHLENTCCLSLDKLKFIILDEFDRLVDSGFEKKILQILERINQIEEKCFILSSATPIILNQKSDQPSQKHAKNSIEDKILSKLAIKKLSATCESSSSLPSKNSIPKTINQQVMLVPRKYRLSILVSFLLDQHYTKNSTDSSELKIVIFFSCCDAVNFYYSLLSKLTLTSSIFSFSRLHGGLEQKERKKVFLDFLQSSPSSSRILCCTDIAARGLDFPNVRLIVQFDPPCELSDYIHRIGRTGRGTGTIGESILFLDPEESQFISKLESSIPNIKQNSALIDENLSKAAKKDRQISTNSFHIQNLVQNDEELKIMAMDAFRSSVRAYSTHSRDLRSIFDVKKIHLGHFAKSFGLVETPSTYSSKLLKARPVSKEPKHQNQKKLKIN